MFQILVKRIMSGLFLLMLPGLCQAGLVIEATGGENPVVVSSGDTINLRADFTEPGLANNRIGFAFTQSSSEEESLIVDIVGTVDGCDIDLDSSLFGTEGFVCQTTSDTVKFDFSTNWGKSLDGQISVSVAIVDFVFSSAPLTFESNKIDVRVKQSGYVVFQSDGDLRVEESDGVVSIMAERIQGSDGPLDVDVDIRASSTAVPVDLDSDLTLLTQSLSWADGETAAKPIDIRLIHDTEAEPLESFALELSGDGDDYKEIFLIDSPQPGAAVFKSASSSFSEDDGTVDIVLSRAGGQNGALSATVSIESGGSATSGADYQLTTESVTWADGDTSDKTISVEILSDDLLEGEESFALNVAQTPAASGTGQGVTRTQITIRDATVAPIPGNAVFKSASSIYSEADGAVDIVLSRTGGQDGLLSATVSVVSGGSATAGSDYQLGTQSLTWADGDTADKSISVELLPDDLLEGDETFVLNVAQTPAASGAGQGAFNTQITIRDATVLPGSAVLSITELRLNEGESQSVTVNREGGFDGVMVVDLSVDANGTATEAEDFSLSVQSLRWEDGDDQPKSFEISAVADRLQETLETLTVLLDDSTGSIQRLQVTILDTLFDDPADYEIAVISGADQTGALRTEALQPFVVRAVDAAGVALEGVPVYWTVTPQDAGTLSAGAESETDITGEAANVFTVTKNGPIVVTVSLDEIVGTNSQRAVSSQRAVNSPRAVQFLFDGGIAGLPGLEPEERVFARGVDQACQSLDDSAALTAGAEDLQTICEELEASNNLTADLNLLAFEEIASQGRLITETANFRVNNVRRRLDQIRRGEQGVNLSGIGVNLWGKKLPSSVLSSMTSSLKQTSGGGDAFTSPWGGFVNASIGIGDKESTSREIGFDFTVQDFSFGADYRLNNELALGAGLSWMNSETDFNGSAGNLDSDSLGLFIYATRYLSEQLYLDGIFSYSSRDFDIRRNLIGSNSAVGGTSGTDLTLGLSGGYEYQRGKHLLSPFFRVLYTSASVDAYTERATSSNGNGASTTLNIAKQSIDNGSLMLGGEWSTTISSEKGIFRPSARLELEHRLDGDARDVTADFVNDPGHNTLTVILDEPDTDYANLGFGVSAVFDNGKSGAMFYETQLGHEGVTQHWLKVNWRWEF